MLCEAQLCAETFLNTFNSTAVQKKQTELTEAFLRVCVLLDITTALQAGKGTTGFLF